MHIHFEINPFRAHVSSHGHFSIWAQGVPGWRDSPLPGLLLAGGTDMLDECWDSEGREPLELEPHDDGMPLDLGDGRIEKSVRCYIEKHRDLLERRLGEAREKWRAMQERPVEVQGHSLTPGKDRVRIYVAMDGIREHAEEQGEFLFVGADEKCVYVQSPAGTQKMDFSGGGTWRRFVEPAAPRR